MLHTVSKMSSVTFGVRRVLHVDADEELVRRRGVENAAQVVDAGRAVDVEAELRELERDVAADAGPLDLADHRRGRRASRRAASSEADALAELVERHRRAAAARAARAASIASRDRLAGDEAAREAAGRRMP